MNMFINLRSIKNIKVFQKNIFYNRMPPVTLTHYGLTLYGHNRSESTLDQVMAWCRKALVPPIPWQFHRNFSRYPGNIIIWNLFFDIILASARRQLSGLHGPLTRYSKMRVAHAPGMPGPFSPPPTSNESASYRSQHASRHVRHARVVMHVGIDKPRCSIQWSACCLCSK